MRPSRPPQGRFIKSRTAALASAKGQIQGPSWFERTFQLIANITQPLLLLLGTFGYFYTVLPAFQLAQLQEQTAKLEIEKSASEKKLEELVRQQIAVESETKALQVNLERERQRAEQLASNINRARGVAAAATQRAAQAEAKSAEQLRTLDLARWELVLNDWASSYYFASIRSSLSASNSDFQNGDSSKFILDASKVWPNALRDLLAAADSGRRKRSERDGIPETFYRELREKIQAASLTLACQVPDFTAIARRYDERLASLDNEVADAIEKDMEATRRKYRDEGKEAVFSRDYLDHRKNSIRLGKVYELKVRYREEIKVLRESCSEKAMGFLQQVAHEKGVKLM